MKMIVLGLFVCLFSRCTQPSSSSRGGYILRRKAPDSLSRGGEEEWRARIPFDIPGGAPPWGQCRPCRSSPGERPQGTVSLDGGCSYGFGARSRIRAWESESERGATILRSYLQSSSPAFSCAPRGGGRGSRPCVRLVPLARPRRFRRVTGRTALCWTQPRGSRAEAPSLPPPPPGHADSSTRHRDRAGTRGRAVAQRTEGWSRRRGRGRSSPSI